MWCHQWQKGMCWMLHIRSETQHALQSDPHSEEVEGLLEELIPSEEIQSGSSVIRSMTDEHGTIKQRKRHDLWTLWDACGWLMTQLGRACGLIVALSWKLNLSQLMTVLKASVRPVIQVNALPGFIHQVTWKDKTHQYYQTDKTWKD